MLYYSPKWFDISELVDPITLKRFGSAACLSFFNPRLLWTIDRIREHFARPIIVNNWKSGGKFKYRGFRPSWYTAGAEYSQHRFGNALDFNVDDSEITPDKIIHDIKEDHYNDCYKFITAVEADTQTWVHIDLRNRDRKYSGILFFRGG